MVTDAELVPPSLVAEQVRVVPGLSAKIVVGSHPLVEEIGDSPSTTDQVTVASATNQPFSPHPPQKMGVMTGGVVSEREGRTL
jgi:hypothetical protein